jgi:hypothetical protein
MDYPRNWGQCFDVAALIAVDNAHDHPDLRLCHAIGVANAPGEEGLDIAHAWIEWQGRAYDVIWEVCQEAALYRANLKLSYIVEYTIAELWQNWLATDMPGPWDEKILAVSERGNSGALG